MSKEAKKAYIQSQNNLLDITQSQMRDIFGQTGTEEYSGYYQVEPNPIWRDDRRVELVEEMRRTDSAVKAAENAVKVPLLASEWTIQTTGGESKDEEIREFIEKCLFGMENRTWKELLREVLSYLSFGYAVFEQILDVVDGMIVLSDLAPRVQASIQKWQTSDGKPGVNQLIQNDSGVSNADIPMGKLVVFTNDKEGDDLTGQSIFRSAYRSYYMKTNLYKIQGIQAERWGVGIPVVEMSEDLSFGEEDKEKAEELARNIRANQKAYAVMPPGYKLNILTPNGNPIGDSIEKAIDHHNRQIVLSILAQFLMLGGDGGGGSFALSKDQSSFFLKVLEDKASYVAEQFNKHVIKPLVILNYGEQEVYPELKFSPLGDTDLSDMSKVIADLLNAGAITKNSKDEQYIRSIFGFPELSDEEMESVDTKPVVAPKEKQKELSEKKKSSHGECACQPTLLEEYKPWRPLTLAEERIDFVKLNEEFNNLESEVASGMAEVSKRSISSILSRIQSLLNAGKISKVSDVKFPNKSELRKVINDVVKQALAVGKSTASQEMSVKPPSTPNEVVQANKLESDLITDAYTSEIENESKGFVRDAVLTGATTAAIVAGLQGRLNDKARKMISNTAGTVVGQNINRGRDVVFQQNVQQVYALQRSEILDGKTCNMCLSLDKRVVRMDDPMAEMTLAHTNCRGLWSVVLVDDDELPPIKGIPKSIVDKFDLVGGKPIKNSFKQLKKPTNTKDNPEAQEEIKKRLNE
jgi:phage gp29-like protein